MNGTVGSGKTTTAAAVGAALAAQDLPHAVLDLDEVRRTWPTTADDPFGAAVELAALRALASVYRRHGATVLVLAGVLEERAMRPSYTDAVGGSLHVVRLRVPLEEVQARLRARHAADGDGAGLDWHLRRAPELHRILEGAGVDDTVIDVAGRPVADVAAQVLHDWRGS
nr:AAA family ATPase [Ruania alba]